MKTSALILLSLWTMTGIVLLLGTPAAAQTKKELIYTTVERQPEFPGGKAALGRFLAENIQFPGSLMRKHYNTGPVSAKFIIGKDGIVRDVRVSTKPLDKKAQKGMQDFITTVIAAIEKMPRWQPGEVSGQPVAVFYTLPIEVNVQ